MKLYYAVYGVLFIIGMTLGFSFMGGFTMAVGIAASLFCTYVWQDTVMANIVSVAAAVVATYFFITKEP